MCHLLKNSQNILFQTTKYLTGVFSKFNKSGNTKKKEEDTPPSSRPASFVPSPNEHVVKYFGAVPVNVGTGREPIDSSAKVRLTSLIAYLYAQINATFANFELLFFSLLTFRVSDPSAAFASIYGIGFKFEWPWAQPYQYL